MGPSNFSSVYIKLDCILQIKEKIKHRLNIKLVPLKGCKFKIYFSLYQHYYVFNVFIFIIKNIFEDANLEF